MNLSLNTVCTLRPGLNDQELTQNRLTQSSNKPMIGRGLGRTRKGGKHRTWNLLT